MTVGCLLRGAAFLVAAAAVVDPVVPISTPAPLPVQVRATGGASDEQVRMVRERLHSALKGTVNLDPAERPAAIVLVGDRPDEHLVPENVPISTVASGSLFSPNVRIVSAIDPQPILPGWSAIVNVVVEGIGVAGKTTDMTLEQNGIEISKVSHAWTRANERFATALTCPLPEAGVAILTVRAQPLDREVTVADNAADVRAVARARVLKIAAYDPRPSWASAFVRRVLEADPTFAVSTIVRASKGLEVRAGDPPDGITSRALEPFDLVMIGAPEELTATEADALAAFSRRRGGAVLLLPDRRPSGHYVALVAASGFDEMLMENPVALAGAMPGLRSSEFALPRVTDAATVLAAVDQGSTKRPAVVSIPAGPGQVIFSGALDAWRFRASDDEAYSAFWRQLAAVAAAAAPSRLELSIQPGIATPSTPIVVRAEVRGTEVEEDRDRRVIAPISASVVGSGGSAAPIRLWPTAEAGTYEGRLDATAPGRYDVRASLDGRVTADVPLVVSNDARTPAFRDDEGLRLVAQATGGIATDAGDLRPLEAFLESLQQPAVMTPVHVMRSSWWMAAFVSLLCAEWTLRRKRGDR